VRLGGSSTGRRKSLISENFAVIDRAIGVLLRFSVAVQTLPLEVAVKHFQSPV
jgi:hypothetical protein